MNKTHRIAYWLTTTLVTAELALGGVWDVLRILYVRSVIEHLGYPSYFLVIHRRMESTRRASAGRTAFSAAEGMGLCRPSLQLHGPAASHLAVGDGASTLIAPVVFMGLTLASWALRPPSRMALVL
jgi:hypothetical protein